MTPMTATSMSALYGAHIDNRHVQFHAPVAAADTDLPQGACVHLTDEFEFAAGVGTSAVMPLVLASPMYEPDVVMDVPDPATDIDAWVGMASPGRALALPCSGGFEILTTAFVPGLDYTPNTPLSADKTGADKGLWQPGVLYTDMIGGFVSRGVVPNGFQYDALAFWSFPVFPNP